MNYTLVFHILGLILRVEAVLMLPAAVIGIATRGGDGSAFLLAAGITLAVGQALVMLPAKNVKMQARDGFAAACKAAAILAEQGELARRQTGYTPQPILEEDGVSASLAPADLARLKLAVTSAITLGYGREVEPENDEVDLGLAELNEQKKTG